MKPTSEDAKTVRDIADRCFPGRLIGGNVADQSAEGEQAARDDHAAGIIPDPEQCGLPKILEWLAGLGRPTTNSYAKSYRKAMILLEMARCQREGESAGQA